MIQKLDWPIYFMSLALVSALRSSDPSTKVGAVIVAPDNSIVATGYNGFPRGYNDQEDQWYDKPTKYKTVVHAEANAIYNAGRHGKSCEGCSIYLPWFPCLECGKAIAQSGIREVCTLQMPLREDWKESLDDSMNLFMELGIKVNALVPTEFDGYLNRMILDLPIVFGGQTKKVGDFFDA